MFLLFHIITYQKLYKMAAPRLLVAASNAPKFHLHSQLDTGTSHASSLCHVTVLKDKMQDEESWGFGDLITKAIFLLCLTADTEPCRKTMLPVTMA